MLNPNLSTKYFSLEFYSIKLNNYCDTLIINIIKFKFILNIYYLVAFISVY
jgi:hypothetical protein